MVLYQSSSAECEINWTTTEVCVCACACARVHACACSPLQPWYRSVSISMSTGSPTRSLLGSLALLLTPTYCNIRHCCIHFDESTHTHWNNCKDPVSRTQSLGLFSVVFPVTARLPTRRTGNRPSKANLFSTQPLKMSKPFSLSWQSPKTSSLTENILPVC